MMFEYMFHGVEPPSVQCSEAWKLPNGMVSLNHVSWHDRLDRRLGADAAGALGDDAERVEVVGPAASGW